MNSEGWDIEAGQPRRYPGCWMLSGRNSDGMSWAYFRKGDGTYWEVVKEDLLTLEVELGKHVTDPNVLKTLREHYVEWQQARFRVEIFDCVESGFRNFADRESANQYRDSLVNKGVRDANIRIVAINSEGAAL